MFALPVILPLSALSSRLLTLNSLTLNLMITLLFPAFPPAFATSPSGDPFLPSPPLVATLYGRLLVPWPLQDPHMVRQRIAMPHPSTPPTLATPRPSWVGNIDATPLPMTASTLIRPAGLSPMTATSLDHHPQPQEVDVQRIQGNIAA